jgi:hypothetical protein
MTSLAKVFKQAPLAFDMVLSYLSSDPECEPVTFLYVFKREDLIENTTFDMDLLEGLRSFDEIRRKMAPVYRRITEIKSNIEVGKRWLERLEKQQQKKRRIK